LLEKYSRNTDDSFSFRVNTREQSSGVEKFSLFYVPGDTNVDITLVTVS
jgi:hypothetical protein